jgi:hypothetical protein
MFYVKDWPEERRSSSAMEFRFLREDRLPVDLEIGLSSCHPNCPGKEKYESASEVAFHRPPS